MHASCIQKHRCSWLLSAEAAGVDGLLVRKGHSQVELFRARAALEAALQHGDADKIVDACYRAEAAGVDRFIAFHHDPSHDDAFMDGVHRDLQEASPGSLVAIEGMSIDLLSGSVTTP